MDSLPYFPTEIGVTLSKDTYIDAYSFWLTYFKEPLIYDVNKKNEVFRCIVYPSFQPVVMFRIEKDGNSVMLSTVITGHLYEDQNIYLLYKGCSTLTNEDWNELQTELTKADFWRAAFHWEDPNVSYVDGTQCIFEARKGSEYKLISRYLLTRFNGVYWFFLKKSRYVDLLACDVLLRMNEYALKYKYGKDLKYIDSVMLAPTAVDYRVDDYELFGYESVRRIGLILKIYKQLGIDRRSYDGLIKDQQVYPKDYWGAETTEYLPPLYHVDDKRLDKAKFLALCDSIIAYNYQVNKRKQRGKDVMLKFPD